MNSNKSETGVWSLPSVWLTGWSEVCEWKVESEGHSAKRRLSPFMLCFVLGSITMIGMLLIKVKRINSPEGGIFWCCFLEFRRQQRSQLPTSGKLNHLQFMYNYCILILHNSLCGDIFLHSKLYLDWLLRFSCSIDNAEDLTSLRERHPWESQELWIDSQMGCEARATPLALTEKIDDFWFYEDLYWLHYFTQDWKLDCKTWVICGRRVCKCFDVHIKVTHSQFTEYTIEKSQ